MTTPDDRADHLAAIAAELACRVRDETPADNLAWLDQELPDPIDRRDLLFVLAAAIPDDRPWLALTAWTLVSRPAPTEPEADPEGPVLRPAESSRPASRPGKTQQGASRSTQPCGTLAAASRHRYHGEPMCEPCREAYRAYDRERKQVRRTAA